MPTNEPPADANRSADRFLENRRPHPAMPAGAAG